jgi:hypothetical protein
MFNENAASLCEPHAIPADVPLPESIEDAVLTADENSILGVAELVLKNQARVDQLARDESRQLSLLPSLLAIGLVSFGSYALGLVLTLSAAPIESLPKLLAERWADHRVAAALALSLAYAFGFTLATGVCLPSFYFYGLLAGARVSWVQVTA